jgi:hypothetical protein
LMAHDEAATVPSLASHRAPVAGLVSEHHGRVVALGERAVKNIAEPVRVYRVRSGAAPAAAAPPLAVAEPAGSGRPSIAVLPFTNMSGDPEQDYCIVLGNCYRMLGRHEEAVDTYRRGLTWSRLTGIDREMGRRDLDDLERREEGAYEPRSTSSRSGCRAVLGAGAA